MANIVASAMSPSGEASVTETELTGTDTLGVRNGLLLIRNETASSVTVNILGDGAVSTIVPGVGEVDLTGGHDVVVPADGFEVLRLGSIAEFLVGEAVDVTGGEAGVFASILN